MTDKIIIRDQAYPALLIDGDMIAVYAGRDDPQYAVTVDGYPWVAAKPTDAGEPVIAIPTDDGVYSYPESHLVGIVAWAPVRGERALAWEGISNA